jgi:cytochrome P450
MTAPNNPTQATHPDTTTPGPTGYPLVGIIPKMWGQPLEFLLNAAREYGDVVQLDMGGETFYLINNPDYIQHVLQNNYQNYRKGYEVIEPLLGKGLVSSDGAHWQRQRRLMQPAFHRQQLEGFASTITTATADLLASWTGYADQGEALDVAAEMTGLTLRVILETMFSTDIHAEREAASAAFEVALRQFNSRLMIPFEWLDRLPTPQNRRFRQALATLDRIVYGIIAERRRRHHRNSHVTADLDAGNVGAGDLLSMLLAARDEETGTGMSDREIRDEVMTIFLAGHETTANALAWVWYLLSKYPYADRRVENELHAVLRGRTPTFTDLSEFTYTRMVIDEALRLYPPAWMFAREAIDDDQLGRYRIPAGAKIMISPFITHRHASYWANPEGFDPDRFSRERSTERPRYAYFPFGGGPRRCIGEGFALMEAQLVVGMVAQAYRLDLVPGRRVEPETVATLRPRDGVWVTLHPRATSDAEPVGTTEVAV